MSSKAYVVDVCLSAGTESVLGYPKHASSEARAHAFAEQAVRELQSAGKPGEYLVAVSVGQTPIATQIVLVPETAHGNKAIGELALTQTESN